MCHAGGAATSCLVLYSAPLYLFIRQPEAHIACVSYFSSDFKFSSICFPWLGCNAARVFHTCKQCISLQLVHTVTKKAGLKRRVPSKGARKVGGG